MLLEEESPTHAVCSVTLEAAAKADPGDEPPAEGVDPVVAELVAATCGYLYRHMVRRLPRYPIPELRLPDGKGARFLEVGCSWGRWCISATRKGYAAVGVDPSLPAVRAASRVARQLDVDVDYVVADGRALPFRDATFDLVFSYSVLQHFAKADAMRTLGEVARVLRTGGMAVIQMPNGYGVRSLYHRVRSLGRPVGRFDVRYWTPRELHGVFEERIGPTRVVVDGFFSLNAQSADIDLMPRRYRAVIRMSDFLRKVSERLPALVWAADSLYVISTRATE